jgi:hypothetical protein
MHAPIPRRNSVQATVNNKKVNMKASQSIKRAIAIGVVGAMAICEILPASAAPVLSSTALVKATTPDVVDHVRYRRAIGPAIALGVIGAVAVAALQNRYYYSSGYYGTGYYWPGYYGGYGGPGYYGPVGAYPYPYGYNYGYGYGYDRSGAVAAGAALGAVGAILGAASRNPPRAYPWGRYQYHDPQSVIW